MCIVTSDKNDGHGSLRELIERANTLNRPSTITFSPKIKEIRLENNSLPITSNIRIINNLDGEKIVIYAPTSVIDARHFTVSSDFFYVKGLILKEGSASSIVNTNPNNHLYLDEMILVDNSNPRSGGAISTIGSLTIKKSTINRNKTIGANNGGGISVTGTGEVHIENSKIQYNILDAAPTGNGGGIYVTKNCTIIGCSIDHNTIEVTNPTHSDVITAGGGGISFTASSSTLKIQNSTIAHNFSGTSAGGILVLNPGNKVLIDSSKISANTALSIGGGIASNSTTNIEKSEISHNIAVQAAGIIGVEIILHNTIVTKNTATANCTEFTPFAGGILAGSLILKKSHVDDNSADIFGGGVVATQNVTMIDSTIDNNNVTVIDCTSFAGGIYVDNGILTMTRSSISCNKVAYDEHGGLGNIVIFTGEVNILNSKISHNTAYSLPGILMGSGNVQVYQSEITHNRSTSQCFGGGAITILLGAAMVQNSKINHNVSRGLFSAGITSFLADVTVNDSEIVDNITDGPGGAIASYLQGSVMVNHSKLCTNTAASIGSAIVNFSSGPGSQIVVNSSTIQHNTLTDKKTIADTFAAFNTLYDFIIQITNIVNIGEGTMAILTALSEMCSALTTTISLLTLPNFNNNGIAGTIASILGSPITVVKSNIHENVTHGEDNISYGGAIFSPNSTTQIVDSTICGNQTTSSGSAIASGDSLVLVQTKVSRNLIDQNLPVDGVNDGALYNLGNMTVIASQICNNKSPFLGGGIYNAGTAVFVDTSIDYNSASEGGGIYSTGEIMAIDSTMKGNQPDNI